MLTRQPRFLWPSSERAIPHRLKVLFSRFFGIKDAGSNVYSTSVALDSGRVNERALVAFRNGAYYLLSKLWRFSL